MKLKELAKDTSLDTIKVRIPDKHKHQAVSVGLDVMEVYIISTWFMGVWVKSDTDSERMYPLTDIFDNEILDWEVVE